MKKVFEMPLIELLIFETDEDILLSGLTIMDGNIGSEEERAFSDIMSIFYGI